MTIEPIDPMIAQASELIERRTGLAVGAQFRLDLSSILHNLAKGDLAQFLSTLQANRDTSPEWQSLMRALTIGETYFFRDTQPFTLLRNTILPNILQERRQKKRQEITIWCAGCATGEEVYSIAISLYEMLPDLAQWTIRLTGTDINAYALESARQAIYRDWSFRHTAIDLQDRYFDSVPGGWRVKPFIRDMVTFWQSNLFDGSPNPGCDVIFCRNTLLYFARGYTEIAETILHSALTPGGWLILGQSEAIRWHRERWVVHLLDGTTLYQKQFVHNAPAVKPRDQEVNAGEDSYADAVEALHHDRVDDARRILGSLIAKQPDHIPARLLLAYVLACRHQVADAHKHLDHILQQNSMVADAYYLRATLHLETEQAAEAERALRSALYCQRDHPLAAFLLGNLAYKAGNRARALRAWETARRAVTSFPPDSWFSDFTDMTAAGFEALIHTQIGKA